MQYMILQFDNFVLVKIHKKEYRNTNNASLCLMT